MEQSCSGEGSQPKLTGTTAERTAGVVGASEEAAPSGDAGLKIWEGSLDRCGCRSSRARYCVRSSMPAF